MTIMKSVETISVNALTSVTGGERVTPSEARAYVAPFHGTNVFVNNNVLNIPEASVRACRSQGGVLIETGDDPTKGPQFYAGCVTRSENGKLKLERI